MAKDCPVCGNKEFTVGPDVTNAAIRASRRICVQCGREYLVHRPDYVNGLAAYLIAATILFFMLVNWFAPPRDFPMHFTWYGRAVVLVAAVGLFGVGTMMLAGKPWR